MAESSVEISVRSPPPQLAVVLAHAQTRESLRTGRLKVILRFLLQHVPRFAVRHMVTRIMKAGGGQTRGIFTPCYVQYPQSSYLRLLANI
jgi:hypothetical protein